PRLMSGMRGAPRATRGCSWSCRRGRARGTPAGATSHNRGQMDPSRKRRVRLVVALTAAVLLAGALIYTSFSSATEAKQPSQVVGHVEQGQSLQLTGKVV